MNLSETTHVLIYVITAIINLLLFIGFIYLMYNVYVIKQHLNNVTLTESNLLDEFYRYKNKGNKEKALDALYRYYWLHQKKSGTPSAKKMCSAYFEALKEPLPMSI